MPCPAVTSQAMPFSEGPFQCRAGPLPGLSDEEIRIFRLFSIHPSFHPSIYLSIPSIHTSLNIELSLPLKFELSVPMLLDTGRSTCVRESIGRPIYSTRALEYSRPGADLWRA